MPFCLPAQSYGLESTTPDVALRRFAEEANAQYGPCARSSRICRFDYYRLSPPSSHQTPSLTFRWYRCPLPGDGHTTAIWTGNHRCNA
jgi:hypothetical protein